MSKPILGGEGKYEKSKVDFIKKEYSEKKQKKTFEYSNIHIIKKNEKPNLNDVKNVEFTSYTNDALFASKKEFDIIAKDMAIRAKNHI